MGEDIWRNVSVLEELHGIVEKIGKDMKKVQVAAIRLNGRMGYHSNKLYDVSSAYYQFTIWEMQPNTMSIKDWWLRDICCIKREMVVWIVFMFLKFVAKHR